MKMTQKELIALIKLLRKWELEFVPPAIKSPDDSQPMYGEVIRCLRAQVQREID